MTHTMSRVLFSQYPGNNETKFRGIFPLVSHWATNEITVKRFACAYQKGKKPESETDVNLVK